MANIVAYYFPRARSPRLFGRWRTKTKGAEREGMENDNTARPTLQRSRKKLAGPSRRVAPRYPVTAAPSRAPHTARSDDQTRRVKSERVRGVGASRGSPHLPTLRCTSGRHKPRCRAKSYCAILSQGEILPQRLRNARKSVERNALKIPAKTLSEPQKNAYVYSAVQRGRKGSKGQGQHPLAYTNKTD